MDIDRSRFMLLTASLAAACNQSQVAQPSTPSDDPGSSPALVAAEPSGRATDEGPDETRDGESPPSVWLEIPPGSQDVSAPSSCDESPPQLMTCHNLEAPAGHCESFDDTFRLCNSFPAFLQPRPANAAIECMLEQSGSQGICSWRVWNDCTQVGLQAACIEADTRATCDTVSSSCGGSVETFTCQRALSAIRPRHRASAAACIQEFCETDFCITDLSHR